MAITALRRWVGQPYCGTDRALGSEVGGHRMDTSVGIGLDGSTGALINNCFWLSVCPHCTCTEGH